MNRFRPTLMTLALLTVSAAALAQNAPADIDWKGTYLKDLEFARKVIAEDHPGPVDDQNPAFRRTLESAYEEARNAAPRVKDYTSYAIALRRFGNRFQDAHLSIGGPRPLEGARTAGIYPVWRNGSFVVEEVDPRYGEALKGATIESCDGAPAPRLFTENVLSWRGRPDIAADWFLLAPLLLVDYGPPTLEQCVFRTGKGTETVALQWKAAPDEEIQAAQERLSAMPDRPLRVSRLADGTVWVDVPTFLTRDESSVAAMRGMIDSLGAEMKQNRAWKLLVFDLRGNRGGASQWGQELAAAVFGKEWAGAAWDWLQDGPYIDWRPSNHNAEAQIGMAKQREMRHGKDDQQAAAMRRFAATMKEAVANGRPLIEQRWPVQGLPRPPAVEVPGRIVAVTSASCYSACLDFLDILRLHPAVVQVGQTTGVDTVYMDTWTQDLPSGLGYISHPMKVYRDRKRKNNEAYTPKVVYEGRLADTEALRRWITANYQDW